MKSGIFFSLLLAFCLVSSERVQAQAAETDSLALLCIYLDLDGPNWDNNFGWATSAPVPTWEGVTVENNRVTRLELPSNNLRGTIPPDISVLTQLEVLDLGFNAINGINVPLFELFLLDSMSLRDNNLTAMPTFGTSVFAEIDLRKNNLDFADIETLEFSTAADFTYQPQDSFGRARTVYVLPNADLELDPTIPFGGSSNVYTWYRDAVVVSNGENLFLSSANGPVDGVYDLKVTSNIIPGVELNQSSVTVSTLLLDSLGGPFIDNQLIVEFADDATQFEKDTLLDWYQATRLDSCLCGVIELWELPDTSLLGDGSIIVGVEQTKDDARQKPKVEETGNNYVTDLLRLNSSRNPKMGKPTPIEKAPPPPAGGDPSVVAIIDSGIDYTHPMLSNYIWVNPGELTDGLDSDGNCLVDDGRGFNLVGRDNDPFDDSESGHGTHVAGIVSENLLSSKLDLMNLKSHDSDGFGTLFNGVCGIYYAREEQADVINLSWGYRGVESLVLRNSIIRAGEACNALIVASAGNEGRNNDFQPHYPSSYDLDNILSVGALNLMEDDIAPFSNYGIESVDILAPGTRIFSTVPGGTQDFKDGTSMAAAYVSGLVAEIRYEQPDLSFLDIRRAILETAEFMPPIDSVLTMGKVDRLAALAYADTTTINDLNCLITNVEAPATIHSSPMVVFPQPFRTSVVFEFDLERSETLDIQIYDAMGRQIDYVSQTFVVGTNRFVWSPIIDLPGGVYFYTIRGQSVEWSGRLMKN
ncbi:MAG: S8 family serine peptidase [Bacteroidota bacterium]